MGKLHVVPGVSATQRHRDEVVKRGAVNVAIPRLVWHQLSTQVAGPVVALSNLAGGESLTAVCSAVMFALPLLFGPIATLRAEPRCSTFG